MNGEEAGTYPSAPEEIALRVDPPPKADGRETVTALTICRDNENTIRACMESVKWCDEILVVVDPRSVDSTREIVREYTDRVFEHEFTFYGAQRNFAIPRASCDWILVVDSDEAVTPQLRDDILEKLRKPEGYDAFNVRRIAYFLGKPMKRCGWGNEKQLRLFRRDKGRYDQRRVHENIHVRGPVGQIDGLLLHDTVRSLKYYFRRFNRFTSEAAADLKDKGKRATLSRLLLRPPVTFMKMYFIKLGFLEGIRGLLLCVLSSLYVFTKYAKLWELGQESDNGQDRGGIERE